MGNVLWVDENDNVLGTVSREKAHAEGLLHRIATIYLVNDQGQILINERADNGMLDHSSAGHVEMGESWLEAANRELAEELGTTGAELTEIGTTEARELGDLASRYHLFKLFVCNASPGKINENEVRSVFWANPHQIMEDMRVHPEKYTEGFKATLKVFLSR